MSSTLLILGGSRYILPVIEAAHAMDCRVVTCDYLPDNIAHQFSDEYINASIVDKDAVLEAAKQVKADGIMSFAADPGVISAAYTAEKLGLPFQGSYDNVRILQNKDFFRNFLSNNGFNCPQSFLFGSCDEAMKIADSLPYPVIVKPTDSAGSKGVSRVEDPESLKKAVEYALGFSISGKCIVEQFIEKQYPSSDSEGFTVDGKFECISFTSQLFDLETNNIYAPAAYEMPAAMPESAQETLRKDLQRLADVLKLQSGIYNIETRVGTDGKPYIMELSPRGGGNRLAEMLRLASGVDLIDASVAAAIGVPVSDVTIPQYDGYWYQEILHANREGVFRGIEYSEDILNGILQETQLWIEPGKKVMPFTAANYAFGTVFLRFESKEKMEEFRKNKNEYMRVVID